MTLFTFAEYWWLYCGFSVLVLVLLSVDLFFHRQDRAVTFRAAFTWTAVWVALALTFSYGLYLFAGARFGADAARRLTLEFLAGYVVEESLSVDNMFVFALVFRYFAVPDRLQHRVLFYGVLGALIFRGVFIALGSALVRFHWVMIAFGLFLIYTGVRMALAGEERHDPGSSPVIRWARRWLPVTSELHGHRFWVRLHGRNFATPLLIVLLVLETTDIVFAVDSVPAVFAVTREPLIVFTSNVFAILGLRSLYFVLAGAMGMFHALQYGLSVVLVFVGVKMALLDELAGGRFPIGISLAIICGVIAASVAYSLAFPQKGPRPRLAWLVRSAIGVVCLALAAVSLLTAWGPARDWALLDHLAEVDAVWFCVSAACYAAMGVLLLRRRAL